MQNDPITHLHWNEGWYVPITKYFTKSYDDIPYTQYSINGSIVGLIKHRVPEVFKGTYIVKPDSTYTDLTSTDAFQKDRKGISKWIYTPLDTDLIRQWLTQLEPINKHQYDTKQMDVLLRIRSLLNYYTEPEPEQSVSSYSQNLGTHVSARRQLPEISPHQADADMRAILEAQRRFWERRGGRKKKSRKTRKVRRRKHSSKRR
jgi:hypothetical protein